MTMQIEKNVFGNKILLILLKRPVAQYTVGELGHCRKITNGEIREITQALNVITPFMLKENYYNSLGHAKI